MNFLKFELSEEIYRLLDFILLPIINYVEEEEICNSHVSNFKRISNKNTETSYRRNCHEGDGKYKFHISERLKTDPLFDLDNLSKQRRCKMFR